MTVDVDSLMVAGFAIVPLVVWLVQTFREAFQVPGRYLPLICLPASMALLAVGILAPPKVATIIGGSVAVSAAASAMVRYATRSSKDAEGS